MSAKKCSPNTAKNVLVPAANVLKLALKPIACPKIIWPKWFLTLRPFFIPKTRGGAIGLVPGQSLLIYSMLRPIQGCDEQVFTETISQFHEAAKSLLLDLDIK